MATRPESPAVTVVPETPEEAECFPGDERTYTFFEAHKKLFGCHADDMYADTDEWERLWLDPMPWDQAVEFLAQPAFNRSRRRKRLAEQERALATVRLCKLEEIVWEVVDDAVQQMMTDLAKRLRGSGEEAEDLD